MRANYQNAKGGIRSEPRFLELFFRNLLMGENNELKNRHMLIGLPQGFDCVEAESIIRFAEASRFTKILSAVLRVFMPYNFSQQC